MQPTENAVVQVRLSGAEFDSLENWRRAQEKIPPRLGGDPGGHPPAGACRGRRTDRSCRPRQASRFNVGQKHTVRRRAGPYVNPADPIGETIGRKMQYQQYSARKMPASLNYGKRPARASFPPGPSPHASACQTGARLRHSILRLRDSVITRPSRVLQTDASAKFLLAIPR